MPDLEKELEVYKKNLPSLLGNEGKFVLVGNGQVAGVFTAYQDALQAGYAKFGMRPFLVKQISAQEQVSYFSRDIGAVCQA
jgi:hypothetical protein